MITKIIYKFLNLFRKKKIDSTKNGIVYSREFISKMMANDYSQIVNAINEVKLKKEIKITITSNVHCEFEKRFDEVLDPFCTLFKENKANTLIFYGNIKNEFVRYCGDDLCYGQYTEGAELSEGQFEILFKKLEQNKYDKIEVALGLYDEGKSKDIDFSKRCVVEFIIVIWAEGKQFCYIVENSIDTKSKFINILTLNKIDTEWFLSVDLKCYDNPTDFINKNFDNLQINASS